MYDRSKSIGASDAVHIQKGDWAPLYDRKTSSDEPEYGLAAELGHRLEAFNLELFARETGREVFVDPFWQSDPMTHSLDDWCKFLPDGLIQRTDAETIEDLDTNPHPRVDEFYIPVEAKCINMMWKPENLLTKYMPQLQHAMRVMGAPYCYLSVIRLNVEYYCQQIPYDPAYDDALFEKEKLFMWFLENKTRPPEYKGKRKGWV